VSEEAVQRATKSPPILFEKTQELIARIQCVLDAPLITYWNSTSGSICSSDVVALYAILRRLGPKPRLNLLVRSGGGYGNASLRMVHLLREFTTDLTVLAPLDCESAATMLALGANRIKMGPLAYLSAVDTSLTHDLSPVDRDNERVKVGHDELERLMRLWRGQIGAGKPFAYEAIFPFVHPLVIGAVDRASALSERLCMEILSYHIDDRERARAISHTLNTDYPSHSYPITIREAQRIGLKVEPMSDDVNGLLLELNEVYSEMGQKATTDFDESNSHDSSVLNIIEAEGLLIFFQNDKDWHYRPEERRWVTLNNNSNWRRAEIVDGKLSVSVFHN
jgi:hypothetical protein